MNPWDNSEDDYGIDPHTLTISMIGEWIDNSPVCNSICEDAKAGCKQSEDIINGITLRMETAQFFMTPEHLNEPRIEKELTELVDIKEGLN